MSQCKKVHIGVFFDGTGNNKVNDEKDNGRSNIAKLSKLYICGKITNWSNEQCEHYGDVIYKCGVGTKDATREFVQDKIGKGYGKDGAKRINDAINDLNTMLSDKLKGKYSISKGYRERIIDVFGFSRGAAMARDFVNSFYKRNLYELKLQKVRFNFVGLYDTVGSFEEAGNEFDFRPTEEGLERNARIEKSREDTFFPGLTNSGALSGAYDTVLDEYTIDEKKALAGKYKAKVNGKEVDLVRPYNFSLAPNSANKIVHMVASDEVRAYFPLTSVQGAGEEYVYAGVHSDIGGGYPNIWDENHQVIKKVFSEKEKNSFVQEIRNRYPDIKLTVDDYSERMIQAYFIWSKSWVRKVPNDLTYVTLHRMHELAVKHHVPFKTIPNDKEYTLPKSMAEYNSYTIQNHEGKNYPKINELKEKFFHHSAVDQNHSDTQYVGNQSVSDMLHKDSPDHWIFHGNNTYYKNGKPSRVVFGNQQMNKPVPPTPFIFE